MIGGNRDWRQTLAPASYNGFAFFVDSATLPKSGRDVAVHSFVNSEEHATEDMGRVPRELKCDAYLVGDDVDTRMDQLIEICSTPGAFTLALPMFRPYQARCQNCHAHAPVREKGGYVKFELQFVEAGTAGTSFSATPLGDRQGAAAMDQMPDTAGNAVAAVPPTPAVKPSPSYTLPSDYGLDRGGF